MHAPSRLALPSSAHGRQHDLRHVKRNELSLPRILASRRACGRLESSPGGDGALRAGCFEHPLSDLGLPESAGVKTGQGVSSAVGEVIAGQKRES
jgi:hypothetical protein